MDRHLRAEGGKCDEMTTIGETARRFAVDVQREINIRNGNFAPDGDREKKWRAVGPVHVRRLDTVALYFDGRVECVTAD